METSLELDVFIYPDEVRIATPEDLREWELEAASQVSKPSIRLFVALYPYNPAAMSPNPDTAAEELPFVPGQIIKVRALFPPQASTYPRNEPRFHSQHRLKSSFEHCFLFVTGQRYELFSLLPVTFMK